MTLGHWFDLGNLLLAGGALAVAIIALRRTSPSERVAQHVLDGLAKASIQVRADRDYLYLRNVGNAPAQTVTVKAVKWDHGLENPLSNSEMEMPISVIQPGSEVRIHVFRPLAAAPGCLVEIRWSDPDEKEQFITDTIKFG